MRSTTTQAEGRIFDRGLLPLLAFARKDSSWRRSAVSFFVDMFFHPILLALFSETLGDLSVSLLVQIVVDVGPSN